MHIACDGGPFDGRMFDYPDPIPDLVVIADDSLHYHEYARVQRQYVRHVRVDRSLFAWHREYHVDTDGEVIDEP